MAVPTKNIDILMVGKTGNGKSALGNMILQKRVFKSKNELESVTKDIQSEYSDFEGTAIKIVDGPGVGDTEKDKAKAVSLVVNALTNAVVENVDGFHAIVIVVRYGGRYTDEDIKTIKVLKDIFGESFVSKHGILVMTCGDVFADDAEENDNETFEHWCQRQGGVFRELLAEVNNRVILFNNKAKKEAAYEQIRCLLQLIEKLCRSKNGARYTSEIFEDAKKSRERLVVESNRPLLDENIKREMALINEQLELADKDNPLRKLGRLSFAKTRAENLLETITEQDKGTKAFDDAITAAKTLISTIAVQEDHVEKMVEMREKEETLERKAKEMEEKRASEEKEREMQRKREEEKEKKKQIEKEKRREEERERRRLEDEKRAREDEERRRIDELRVQHEIEKLKNEKELLEAFRREEESKRAERLEDERRDALRRDEERRDREEQWRREDAMREEQRRRDEETRRREDQERQEEKRRQDEKHSMELEMLRVERENMERARQDERDMEMAELKREIERLNEAEKAKLAKEKPGFFGRIKRVFTGYDE